ncbi:FeoA family protein [Desulfoscipio geothermicus]|uniref:Ferrous iron transport protein A n=1 Tax=Desulfoscipio geothermicus DSM 3669 TaxID=1121426 RepID=A0A1I6DTA4_9FIRM|nr:FeoA family protein [Desulfoscipio geothermicus]SFR08685.1 ferrous iron transport protein A [Desulfoscipio geothermicus DSM 3669]
MAGKTTLNNLPSGSFALVTEVLAEGLIRRRLLDLGLVPGTRVEVVRRSPAGDPTAFNIRGAIIALRKEVAGQVLVSPLGDEAAG